jgi:lipopolysaccharide transport system permease protein
VSVIDGFRWSLLGASNQLYWPGLVLSVTLVSLMLVSGFLFFRSTERTFADVI